MAKDDCDAIMFDTFLEPVYQGNILLLMLLYTMHKYQIR